jgi:hypothetical protein
MLLCPRWRHPDPFGMTTRKTKATAHFSMLAIRVKPRMAGHRRGVVDGRGRQFSRFACGFAPAFGRAEGSSTRCYPRPSCPNEQKRSSGTPFGLGWYMPGRWPLVRKRVPRCARNDRKKSKGKGAPERFGWLRASTWWRVLRLRSLPSAQAAALRMTDLR